MQILALIVFILIPVAIIVAIAWIAKRLSKGRHVSSPRPSMEEEKQRNLMMFRDF